MAYRESTIDHFLGDFAKLGVNFWMTKDGWFWVQRGLSWKLGETAPVHGPFNSASDAAKACEGELGVPVSARAQSFGYHLSRGRPPARVA